MRRGLLAGRPVRDEDLCSGPGKLTQAMGITLADNGSSLSSGTVRIRPRDGEWLEPAVVQGTRVGITRAVELPWRFSAAGSRYVSRPRPPALAPPRPCSARAGSARARTETPGERAPAAPRSAIRFQAPVWLSEWVSLAPAPVQGSRWERRRLFRRPRGRAWRASRSPCPCRSKACPDHVAPLDGDGALIPPAHWSLTC